MSVADRLAAARAGIAASAREQELQRDLRERHVEDVKRQASESMTKQAETHGKYITHMQELSRRQQKAGGWATEKTLSDKDHTMGFGFDDEPPAEEFTGYAAPSYGTPDRAPEPEPPAAPSAPAAPAVPVVPESPVPNHSETTESVDPPSRRRGRHSRRDEDFDEDDFSNNSWLD
jgi:hypothetical protein